MLIECVLFGGFLAVCVGAILLRLVHPYLLVCFFHFYVYTYFVFDFFLSLCRVFV